jgi:hypothetical protein
VKGATSSACYGLTVFVVGFIACVLLRAVHLLLPDGVVPFPPPPLESLAVGLVLVAIGSAFGHAAGADNSASKDPP